MIIETMTCLVVSTSGGTAAAVSSATGMQRLTIGSAARVSRVSMVGAGEPMWNEPAEYNAWLAALPADNWEGVFDPANERPFEP